MRDSRVRSRVRGVGRRVTTMTRARAVIVSITKMQPPVDTPRRAQPYDDATAVAQAIIVHAVKGPGTPTPAAREENDEARCCVVQ